MVRPLSSLAKFSFVISNIRFPPRKRARGGTPACLRAIRVAKPPRVVCIDEDLGNFQPGSPTGWSRRSASRVAWAQAYPTRPVRIIVTFAAGGANDVHSRLFGQLLSERLGQPFIVENRPGGGGNLGAAEAIRSRP